MKYRLPRLELFDEQGLDSSTVRSLKLVILAVTFGIVHFNVVAGIAMAGYLRALGVSDFTFGLLFAIGPALAPLQLAASYLLERTRQRKRILVGFGLAQRMVWIPFGLVPFFIPMEHYMLRIWMVAILLFISAFCGPFMNVAFQSTAADLVPEHIRGRYFAVRMRIFTVVGILGGVVTAWILDGFDPFYSFALVFGLAAISGIADVLCFTGVKYPEMTPRPEGGDKFFKMLREALQNKPYMRFIIFMTLWMFSLNLSGPFILVHLREGVQLSNTLITFAVQILPNICSVLILSHWGRTLDTHGNKTTMQVANGILCFVPFLWIFTGNNPLSIVFILIIGLMNGLLFPAFDLGANNIMLGHAPKVNRSMYIALYFTCTSIIGIGLANATGGWLLDNVFSTFETGNFSRYNYLFALSAVLRCIMIYVALPRMVKDESPSTPWELLAGMKKGARRKVLRRWAWVMFMMRRFRGG